MPNNSQQDIAFQPATKGYSFSTNPSSPEIEERKKRNKAIILLLLEILGLVAVFVVFLLILNFFNIISLSKIYPNQLGWLPHLRQTTSLKPTTQNQIVNTQPTISPSPQPQLESSASLKVIPMGTCPLPDGCQNAAQISSVSTDSAQANFAGLGFTLASSQSAILAMREGELSITNTVENGENLTVVTITDPANVQEYVYKFNKTAYIPSISSGNVTEGQKIAELKNVPTITYSSKPYSFILYMQSLITKEYLKLESSADGKTINSPNK